MLSHTLHTGCVIWQDASLNIAILCLCIHSLHTLNLFIFPQSYLILNHLDREQSRLRFINITIIFPIQLMNILFHYSMMLYIIVSSSLENAQVKIELKNLRCRLFNQFRYIFRFSLTTFIRFLLGWTSLSDDS